MGGFVLDPRLEKDTRRIVKLGLCDLRLMNDRRWPWLILVPQRPGILEIHDMTPLDQTMLAFEADLVAKTLKRLTSAHKLNVAAIGNVVSMLHLHVIARFENDDNWPKPVWGHGTAEPYEGDEGEAFSDKLRRELLAA